MLVCRVIALLIGLLAIHNTSHAQDPYLRPFPSFESGSEATDNQLVIPQPFLALTNANVVDVRNGNILRNVTLILKDGKIQSVGKGSIPVTAKKIDLRGYYLTPGFFDGHFHGANIAAAHRALVSGVTTAKSAGVGGYMDVAIRDMVKLGYLVGPDILAAGIFVIPELGNFLIPALGNSESILADPRLYKYSNQLLHGEAALREVVKINAEHGVDWIKTRSGGLASNTSATDALSLVYSVAELAAIVDEAKRYKLPVSCHAHGSEVIIAAVKAGCTTIEHGSYIDQASLRLMKQHGTIWIPTYISTTGFKLPHDDYNSTTARRVEPHIVENLGRMIRKGHGMGLTILASVDSPYGPESVYRVAGEINAFIEFGMSPIDALRAATINSAKAYGLEKKTGAIEAGLEADLLIFDRNPLQQPSVLHNPLAVISNGRIALNRLVGKTRVLANY